MNEILIFKLILLVLFLLLGLRFFYIGKKGLRTKKISIVSNSILLIFCPTPTFKGRYAVWLSKIYIAMSVIVIALGLFVVFILFA